MVQLFVVVNGSHSAPSNPPSLLTCIMRVPICVSSVMVTFTLWVKMAPRLIDTEYEPRDSGAKTMVAVTVSETLPLASWARAYTVLGPRPSCSGQNQGKLKT